MGSTPKTSVDHYEQIQDLIRSIRDWSCWRQKPLTTMRGTTADFRSATIALYAYYRYVRRFTIGLCAVLAKVPEADERFWRLAGNLHDELGGGEGLSIAHGLLIEKASKRPEAVSVEDWKACASRMDKLEEELLGDFSALPWPHSLFALGPGTEAISDLFLDPVEHWSSVALEHLAPVKTYFELHRPAVEFEHQNEISLVLAEELDRIPSESAVQVFSGGQGVALRMARRHHRAVCLCWELSASEELQAVS